MLKVRELICDNSRPSISNSALMCPGDESRNTVLIEAHTSENLASKS